MTIFAFVTIGQSPRTDVLQSMFPDTDASSWLQAGALDDLEHEAIHDLHPAEGEPVLVTRLRNGAEAAVSRTRLLPHLERAIAGVAARGATQVVVLCTGEFPGLRSPVPVIYPDRILSGAVNAIFPAGTLGVVMPHAGQRETMLAKWRSPDRPVVTVAASPYSSAADLESAARSLAGDGAGLVLLDCMGFDEPMRARVSSAVDVPVVLANRLTGRVLEELLTPTGEPAELWTG